MSNPLQEIGNEIWGAIVLAITAGLFILILSTLGSAVTSVSPQAAGVTNYGIIAIVIIAGGAGIAGFIKLIQIISESAGESLNGRGL
ncbi:MAG: hypothetical protein ABR981_01865 [Candidatus Micrarchaeaceae archaeon]|jgi:uncharacterized membrane-anchored protein